MEQMSIRELRAYIKRIRVNNVNWVQISRKKNLSENFMREFANKVDWFWISRHQKLSESFIREFADKVYWAQISINQRLSESFIREFANKVDWFWLSRHQKLSESFIRKFAHKVNWVWISKRQKLSEAFIKEFSHTLPREFDVVIANEFHCGPSYIQIYIHKSKPNIIHMGCFEGTKAEALAAVSGKYSGKIVTDYKRKIKSCFKQIGR